jgi:ribose transport system permease protein
MTSRQDVTGGRLPGFRRSVARNQAALFAALILLVLIGIYQYQSGRLLTPFQLKIMVNGSMATVFAAVGLTIVLVSGGFDLSIGAIISLTNVLLATLMSGSAIQDSFVVVLVLGVGLGAGLINGILVEVGRLPSIIVTLATMFIWSGVALLLLPQPGGFIARYLSDALAGTFAPWAPAGLLWLGLLAALLFLFHRTPWRSMLFATGADARAAARAGVRTNRVTIGAFGAAGLCYAIAGLFVSAQGTGGDANIGNAFLLTTFAAALLGGTPLGGGRGTFAGAILGGFIVATLGMVLLSLDVTSYMTDVVQGMILIIAVLVPIVGRRLGSIRRRQAEGWAS